MGIYIAEDAPKGCLDCKLHNYLGVYAQCFWTKSVIDEFTYDGDPKNPTRPDDCPLVPVSPHGDLIDRDALRDNNCDAFEINGADGTILAMDVSIIDDASAIIPASE